MHLEIITYTWINSWSGAGIAGRLGMGSLGADDSDAQRTALRTRLVLSRSVGRNFRVL